MPADQRSNLNPFIHSMPTHYIVKIRKDIAIAIPILLLLILGYYGGKTIWQWQPGETKPEEKTYPTEPTQTSLIPGGIGCAELQEQMDQVAQQGFKDGYLCQKKRLDCPIPEGLGVEQRGQLRDSQTNTGIYFDAKKYLYEKSPSKDYYASILAATYPCTNKTLTLLSTFIYEQQWKTGNTYGE